MSNAGILVLNSGSTSLKFALYAYANKQLQVVAQGGFAGMPANATLSASDAAGGKLIDLTFSNQDNVDHEAALKKIDYSTR